MKLVYPLIYYLSFNLVQVNEITNVISSNNRSSIDIIQSVTDFQDIRAKRNITLMVFWICALNFLGHLPRHIYIILKYSIVMSPILFRFNVLTFAILNLAQGMSFFINYSFNNMFRQTLIEYVRRIFFSRTQKTWFFFNKKKISIWKLFSFFGVIFIFALNIKL